MANQALRITVSIQNRQEMRQQLAVRVLDSKIFLVIAHYCDQHFFGKLEEFRIEVPQNRGRPFGEIHNCIEQRSVLPPASARNGASRGVECFANLVLAFAAAENLRST